MIIEAVLNLFITAIEGLFGWVNLPPLPSSIESIIDQFFGYLEGAVGLLGIFIDVNMVKLLLPILIIVINFEHAWKFAMFVIKKIPFVGIE